mgnify:CR=1 FL=1
MIVYRMRGKPRLAVPASKDEISDSLTLFGERS